MRTRNQHEEEKKRVQKAKKKEYSKFQKKQSNIEKSLKMHIAKQQKSLFNKNICEECIEKQKIIESLEKELKQIKEENLKVTPRKKVSVNMKEDTISSIKKKIKFIDSDFKFDYNSNSARVRNYPEGNRIISLLNLLLFIKTIISHSNICNVSEIYYDNEILFGLASKIKFICKNCKSSFDFITTPFNEEFSAYDINILSVLSSINAGIGCSALTSICSILGIPSIDKKLFIRIQNKLGNIIISLWDQSKKFAIEQEKQLSLIKSDEYCTIKVVGDGAWSKRDSRTYDAKSGCAAIIGLETKKIIYLDVKNKYCSICSGKNEKKNDQESHVCFKNFKGSSSSMEPTIITEGLLDLYKNYKIKISHYLGDGDSSVFAWIQDKLPYGKEISKIECMNHTIKNLKGKLLEIRSKFKLARLLTKVDINYITAYTRIILNEFSSNSEKLQVALGTVIDHCITQNHDFCCDETCKYSQNTDNLKKKIAEEALKEINSYFEKIKAKADRYSEDLTTNLVECFNSIRTKMDGGKIKNLIQRGNFQFRCFAAALRYNEGVIWLNEVLLRLGIANTILENYVKKETKRICYDINRKKKPEYIEQRTQKKYHRDTYEENDDYGELALDYTLIELKKSQILPMCKDFIINLKNGSDISCSTVTINQNSQSWFDERKKRLTASKFYDASRKLENKTYFDLKKLIYNFIDSKPLCTKQMKFGIDNENVAREKYREMNKNYIVKEVGLHQDSKNNNFWLAGSPDGIVLNTDGKLQGIIEIKCVYGEKTWNELLQSKNFYIKENETNNKFQKKYNLKKSHKYYYQIQGNMYIMQVEWCDLVIWGKSVFEIIRIDFDKGFWEELYSKLRKFYFSYLLPEIVSRENKMDELFLFFSDEEYTKFFEKDTYFINH